MLIHRFAELGASLYEICTELKRQSRVFRELELSYSAEYPLSVPIVINLPDNGVRLRFDAPDQRLRLIEVLDFHRSNFTYKDNDLIPNLETAIHGPDRARSSLAYRRIYQLFGPSYPGEFISPTTKTGSGTYVLSYPGIAFSFPLQKSAWSPTVDHATMLSKSASPVTSISIFEGASWPDARKLLFVRKPVNPRCSRLPVNRREGLIDEVEHARIHGAGKVELLRRSSPPFYLILSQTTPQDLITELGPPDQVFDRPAYEGTPPQLPADAGNRARGRRLSNVPNSYGSTRSTPSSVSSNNTDAYVTTDFEDDDDCDTIHGGEREKNMQEQYYCYFTHGFDILLGPPTTISDLPGHPAAVEQDRVSRSDSHKVATRIVLHGNIPGSYPFNRHRRSRWSLASSPYPTLQKSEINSESAFKDFHPLLMKAFEGVWPEKDMSEGMVIVRNWNGRDYEDNDSPSNSAIFVGNMDGDFSNSSTSTVASASRTAPKFVDDGDGLDDDLDDDEDWDAVDAPGESPIKRGRNEDRWLRNTKLYKFPGLMFEVMDKGAISALTVY